MVPALQIVTPIAMLTQAILLTNKLMVPCQLLRG